MTIEHFWSVAVEKRNTGGGRKGLGKRHLRHSQQIHRLWRGSQGSLDLYKNRARRKENPINHQKVPSSSEHKPWSPNAVGMNPMGIFTGCEAGATGWGLRRQNTKYRIRNSTEERCGKQIPKVMNGIQHN